MYDQRLEEKWRTWIECCPSSKVVDVAPEPFRNEMLFHRAVKEKCKKLNVPYVVGEKYNRPHFEIDIDFFGIKYRKEDHRGWGYKTVDEVAAYLIYLNRGFWKIDEGAPVPVETAREYKYFIGGCGELHIDINEVVKAAKNGKLLPRGYLLLKDKELFATKKKDAGIGVYVLTPRAYFNEVDFDGNYGTGVWHYTPYGHELPSYKDPDYNVVRSRYRQYASSSLKKELDTWLPEWVSLDHPYYFEDRVTKNTTWTHWVEQYPKKFDPILVNEYRRFFKEFSSLADKVHKEKSVYKNRLAYYQQFYQEPLLFEPEIIDWDLVKGEVLPSLQYDLAKFNLYVSRGL